MAKLKVSLDKEYLPIIIAPIRVCANYKPKLGHGGVDGYSLSQFQSIYQNDPFYSWLGLDNPLMYAAHKAAGGMTSVYRQIGIGCESLFRRILRDSLSLNDEDANWSYKLPKSGGKARTLYLDARIPLDSVADKAKRDAIREWMADAARGLGITSKVLNSLQGVVFEVRQGYKSKDSKRQNADIANAATAYTRGLLPCAAILSLQIDEDIALRYRSERWVLLTGLVGNAPATKSVYTFMKEVVGYDLAGFFKRNSSVLKKEINIVLKNILTAK